jgi:hypothetical protein
MRLRRTSLLTSTALRHAGIMMLPPDEPAASGGGGTQQSTVNNGTGQPGNSGQTGGTGTQTENNNSPKFDPAAFWAQSEAPASGSPSSGGSAESGGGASGGSETETPQQKLVKSISSHSFPDAFTKEIGDQIANGDLSGINKSINNLLQQNMQQTLQFAAQMMKMYGEHQQTGFSKLVEQRFGNRDNNDALSKEFPSYNQPGMKPVIDGIFDKAMQNSKGDRAAAIDMTRHMLKFVGSAGAGDLGIPPNSSTSTADLSQSAKSLVDELLSGG